MNKIIIFDINLILKNQIKQFNKIVLSNKFNNLIIKDTIKSPEYDDLCRGRISHINYLKSLEKKYPKIYINYLINDYHIINYDIINYIHFLKKQNINVNLCGDIIEKTYFNYYDYLKFNNLFDNEILSFKIGYIKKKDEEFTEILINHFETSPENIILITNKFKYNYFPYKYGINILNYNNIYDLILDLKNNYK
jgi:hypothetical protein